MVDTTSVQIKAQATNGDLTNLTIGDVNPEANNGALKQFAVGINGLTSNQYASSTRIDKTDLDNIPVKQTPQMTFKLAADSDPITSCTLSELDETGNPPAIRLVRTGDGAIYFNNLGGGVAAYIHMISTESGYLKFSSQSSSQSVLKPRAGQYIIKTEETDDYYAGTFIFTITEG